MASVALEEKIHKIRLKNEEIKRRYEEVEADKKNAAELDALADPVPSEDWPIRKEPPEFSAPVPKQVNKPKHSVRKHNDQSAQFYTGSGEGKKTHTFADGQGPPPDPKYNFLADSEREERTDEIPKDLDKNRGRNKPPRDGFKRRGSGRDWHSTEQWSQHENTGYLTHAEYEAWRAERNRIDEARISRQRTAEGNWRREWDNDKIHLADDITNHENRVTLGETILHNEREKYYRSPRSTRNSYQASPRESHQASNCSETMKNQGSVTDNEKRVVIATEKSIKVLLNPQGSTPPRSSVMSVKVSSPNIAGTGRVGPRQRPRVMYSSQSEADSSVNETSYPTRQRSIGDNPIFRIFEQTQKNPLLKSPRDQRKNEGKMMYSARKDNGEGTIRLWKKDDEKDAETAKSSKKETQKFSYNEKHANPINHSSKFSRGYRKSGESFKDDFEKSTRGEISTNVSGECLGTERKDNENKDATPLENNSAMSIKSESNDIMTSSPGHCESFFKSVFQNLRIKDHKKTSNSPKVDDKAKFNDSLSKIENFDDRAIDRSVSSEATNNDSGFTESQSNESILDNSDNQDVEKNEIDENSSRESTKRVSDDPESFSNDSGNPANIVHSEFSEEPPKICQREVNDSEREEKIESEAREEETMEIETLVEIPKIMEKSEEPSGKEVPIVDSSVKIDEERAENSIDDCNVSAETIEEIEKN